MTDKRSYLPVLLTISLFVLCFGSACWADAVVFTTDRLIDAGDASYDGWDITVRGCVLTVNGAHSFSSLTIERDEANEPGVLTHSIASDGVKGCRLTIAGDVVVQGRDGTLVGSRIDASGCGYAAGAGPGAGASSLIYGSGGGYGGCGSDVSSGKPSFTAYTAFPEYGSGGGQGGVSPGGFGGGSIQLDVNGTLTVNGSILAVGGGGQLDGGGGSGGSISLTVGALAGSGLISADGGTTPNPAAGGGGGGRISLLYSSNTFSGQLRSCGGLGGANGGAGVITTKSLIEPTTSMLIDNGGHSGAVTPFSLTTDIAVSITGGAVGVLDGGGNMAGLHIGAGSTLTHFAGGPYSMSPQVYGDATIDAGGSICVDGRGYPSEQGSGRGNRNNANGTNLGTGASHGGYGGDLGSTYLGYVYGSIASPSICGSGGGGGVLYSGATVPGGSGGGAVKLNVTGTLTINGTISANGDSAQYPAGGGSGGSIWLTAGVLTGSGSISANGGSALPSSGGGAGGRISVRSTQSNTFTGSMTAYGGLGASTGGAGTVCVLNQSPQASLLIDNGGNAGGSTPLDNSQYYYDLTVSGKAVACPWPQGTLRSLHIAADGAMTSLPNSPASGTNVQYDATIDAGGQFTVNGRGYPGDQGTGRGTHGSYYGGGGGFGGNGGAGYQVAGGASYGMAQPPIGISPYGSGGGGGFSSWNPGGAGGGAICLVVGRTLTINGTVSANGNDGVGAGGGGSGGAICLSGGTICGTGSITANGGKAVNPYAGGGSGGRVLLVTRTNTFTGAKSAYGGIGYETGAAGTINIRPSQSLGGDLIIDNGGRSGAGTQLDSSANSYAPNLIVSGKAAVNAYPSLILSTLRLTTGGRLAQSTAPTAGPVIDLTAFGDIIVDSGCAITASGAGYACDMGQGRGFHGSNYGGGAGYGGVGGTGSSPDAVGGLTYGQPNRPTMVGSGGGGGGQNPGGAGGGAIRLYTKCNMTLNGTICADGNPGVYTGGGGSGGSVWLTLGNLTGSGSISANGGDAMSLNSGGGGGGRIDISCIDTIGFNESNITASGGSGYNDGGDGTILLARMVAPIVEDIGDHYGVTGLPYESPTPVITNGAASVSWSLVSGPSGMTINSATGVISWASPSPAGSPHTVTIRATNQAGTATGSWLLTVVDSPKLLPDDSAVRMGDLAVSAVFADSFYVQPASRAWGLQVTQSDCGYYVGAQVFVAGSVWSSESTRERYLHPLSVSSSGSALVSPLGMKLKSLGGADWQCGPLGVGQIGVKGGLGMNNVGLLVKVWGKVAGIDPSSPATWFVIDDGSGHPTKCAVPDGVTIDPAWTFVSVTGISTGEIVDRQVSRMLRVREQADIVSVSMPE